MGLAMSNEVGFEVEGLPEVDFESGSDILTEGEDGTTVYVLKEGAINVYVRGEEVATTSASGTVLGEIAVLLQCPHSATVRADGQTTLYVIDDLKAYLEGDATASYRLSRILASRLVNANSQFVRVKQQLRNLSESNLAQEQHQDDVKHRLADLWQSMDDFWCRDVRHPFGGEDD
jgi:CRP-like cAMP-binding protein